MHLCPVLQTVHLDQLRSNTPLRGKSLLIQLLQGNPVKIHSCKFFIICCVSCVFSCSAQFLSCKFDFCLIIEFDVHIAFWSFFLFTSITDEQMSAVWLQWEMTGKICEVQPYKLKPLILSKLPSVPQAMPHRHVQSLISFFKNPF